MANSQIVQSIAAEGVEGKTIIIAPRDGFFI